MYYLEARNIVKQYAEHRALDNVSIQVPPNCIYGLLGPNGAGKSTTMKIITGYLQADNGQVLVNGVDVKQDALTVQRMIGYLPEHNPLYLDMYVRESLQFTARMYGLKQHIADKVDEMIERTGLTSECHKKIG